MICARVMEQKLWNEFALAVKTLREMAGRAVGAEGS